MLAFFLTSAADAVANSASDTPTLLTAGAAVAAAIISGLFVRWQTKRTIQEEKAEHATEHSGDIRTSEAAVLWEAAEKIRHDLTHEASRLRDDNNELRTENRRLQEENRRLQAEVGELRREMLTQQGEIAELQRLAGIHPRGESDIERREHKDE